LEEKLTRGVNIFYQQSNIMDAFISGAEIRIVDEEDLWEVRELAELIFPVTYQDIVVPRQIDYMMDMIYSPEALVQQLDDGQIFHILYIQEKASGFASYMPLAEAGEFKLNKIYLDPNLQGKGAGKFLLLDMIARIQAAGGQRLLLNVNRHNKARGFYEKMGFTRLREELIDIGGGYFMDDYVMMLTLTPPTTD
jgi:diamine N-acetyltransferase